MITKNYISFYCCFLTLLLFSCGTPQPNSTDQSNTDSLLENIIQYTNENDNREFLYEGGTVHLDEKTINNEKYTIQEITKEKADIKYRAKLIPSILYLKNKGLDKEDLAIALEEVKGEQLFYFEFEEIQKQDLIKKHLDTDLDANVSYLSFDIYNDFKIVTESGDTIPSDYSLYERNFHVAPFERLIVSFSGIDNTQQLQLLYNDKLFGKGQFNFVFASTTYLENNIKNPA